MTMGQASEIPPLDGAADISRSKESQQGEVLADSKNWAGFALVFFGVLATAIAFIALWMDQLSLGLIAVAVAAVGIAGGTVLIALERRR
ncbi:hypothetical protein KHQ06_26145 [Nocardia tengchongensis]|uniref:Uncharacterized protein n=1 Tax=Nocardia tengchongensis TaxID=2055889 RepID=A0ABX8CLK7_9NOCA|nr:hypothetical protein [Nocardia tengchongensis]QVI19794.1 hypothetical protein KHQ06_26145 [Nocardia tengchongensis]